MDYTRQPTPPGAPFFPTLELVLRPSINTNGKGTAFDSTIPVLVLPQVKLDQYALDLHRKGLLGTIELGSQSFATGGPIHTREALAATPQLYRLFQIMRESLPVAWIFFGSPVDCDEILQKAVALYYFLWHGVAQSRAELVGSSAVRTRAMQRKEEIRREQGPAFVFFPSTSDPSYDTQKSSTHENKQRLGQIDSTLAAIGDLFRAPARSGGYLPGDISQLDVKITKTALFKPRSMSRLSWNLDKLIGFNSLERVGTSADARDMASNCESGNVEASAKNKESARIAHYCIPAGSGPTDLMWESHFSTFTRCPIPESVYSSPPQSACCVKINDARKDTGAFAGVSRTDFQDAALSSLRLAELEEDLPESEMLRIRLARESGQPSTTSSTKSVAILAARRFKAAIGDFQPLLGTS